MKLVLYEARRHHYKINFAAGNIFKLETCLDQFQGVRPELR